MGVSAGGLNTAVPGGPTPPRADPNELPSESGEPPLGAPEPERDLPDLAPLDRFERVLLQQAPRLQPAAPAPVVVEQVAQQVSRLWMQGDGRSGRVRLELDGAYRGSIVEVVYDGGSGQLHVDVELSDGAAGSTR